MVLGRNDLATGIRAAVEAALESIPVEKRANAVNEVILELMDLLIEYDDTTKPTD